MAELIHSWPGKNATDSQQPCSGGRDQPGGLSHKKAGRQNNNNNNKNNHNNSNSNSNGNSFIRDASSSRSPRVKRTSGGHNKNGNSHHANPNNPGAIKLIDAAQMPSEPNSPSMGYSPPTRRVVVQNGKSSNTAHQHSVRVPLKC